MSAAPVTVLIAGCGDLGCELGRRLVHENIAVSGLRRSAAQLPHGIDTLQADVTQPQTLSNLPALNPQILVYCVAADAGTDDSYRAHYVDGLRNVLAALKPCANLRHVFFVSSTRVYGQKTTELLDETVPAMPADFGGTRMLEAEMLLQTFAGSSTILRLSGIYGPGRTRMLRLARDPAAWPQHNSWSNRIHRDDAAAFMAMLIQRVLADEPVQDCYIVTDNEPASQYDVLLWLAQQFGTDIANIVVPPVNGGKRLANTRMLQSKFQPTYADYRAGYSALMKNDNEQTSQ